jgi:hypothetical protein
MGLVCRFIIYQEPNIRSRVGSPSVTIAAIDADIVVVVVVVDDAIR